MAIIRRKALRLKEFDYSQIGMYFVTICTKNRVNLFGEINDGGMVLNDFGKIVSNEWLTTPQMRPNIELGEFVVMPNHFHGIIFIRRGVLQYTPTTTFWSPSQTIGSMIRGFKSTVTKKINVLRDSPTEPVWQRNYYDHIIRNDADLNRIREYIINNPLNWETDENK